VEGEALDIKAMLANRPELLHEALDRSLAYLGGVADRPVAPDGWYTCYCADDAG
jgi:hypothetical protein